jgi:1-deoxy-D-xylulose-5-phosphate synthase
MAPADASELARMITTARMIDDRPCAVRFPRGSVGVPADTESAAVSEGLEIGRGRVLRQGQHAAILSCGTRLHACLQAASILAERGVHVTVADARFIKPLDEDLVLSLARHHPMLVTVEDGSVGGFSAHVLQTLAVRGALDRGLIVRPMVLPDVFIDHDSQEAQYTQAGLTALHIAACVTENLTGHETLTLRAI